jgi:hypothetical protein
VQILFIRQSQQPRILQVTAGPGLASRYSQEATVSGMVWGGDLRGGDILQHSDLQGLSALTFTTYDSVAPTVSIWLSRAGPGPSAAGGRGGVGDVLCGCLHHPLSASSP